MGSFCLHEMEIANVCEHSYLFSCYEGKRMIKYCLKKNRQDSENKKRVANDLQYTNIF